MWWGRKNTAPRFCGVQWSLIQGYLPGEWVTTPSEPPLPPQSHTTPSTNRHLNQSMRHPLMWSILSFFWFRNALNLKHVLIQTFLDSKVGPDSIAAYAFAHSVHKHKIAKEKGARQPPKQISWPPSSGIKNNTIYDIMTCYSLFTVLPMCSSVSSSIVHSFS